MNSIVRKPQNTPFIVAASATPNSLTAVQLDSKKLVPPFRSPYLIKEIRFYVTILASFGSVVFSDAAFEQVKISLGHRDLTRGFVPIGSLCPIVQQATDQSGTVGALYGLFRWVLPKPVYARDGEGIEVSVQSIIASAVGATETFEVAVVGEVLPPDAPVPATSCIPYAAAWASVTNATVGSLAVATVPAAASGAVDLQNPWMDKTIHMQRFIGRGYLDEGSGELSAADMVDLNAPIVTLFDSAGHDRTSILPANGVLFGEAFDVRTGCLEHRRPLEPKGFFQANLYNIQAHEVYWISMIGWREEAVT